ncbi:MAG: hypothetical protein SF066_03240 [Thermoanaerobaculia bacterium]|nr:hypothetical protein [Thermoanaerobaculia bacterium]
MIPYVIGQWVNGDRFYGRAALLAELTSAPARSWWAGLRRIGKTSLLRELDHRAAGDPVHRRWPLVWDFQGLNTATDLADSFGEALLDAEEVLDGLATAVPEDPSLALPELGRRARERGGEVLVLIDEADALLDLVMAAAPAVAALWNALAAAGLRVVVVSSPRLADVGLDSASSRYVPGLAATLGAPHWLGPLADDEAADLLRQSRLPAADRPHLEGAEVEVLRQAAGNHPMLLQMLGKRRAELGSVAAALAHVAADRSVANLFAVDFDLLAPAEREFLVNGAPTEAAERLVAFGLVAPKGGGFEVRSPLLAGWLASDSAPLLIEPRLARQ